MKNVALAVQNYASTTKEALPYMGLWSPGSKNFNPFSWAIRNLPFIEQEALYDTLQGADWNDGNYNGIQRRMDIRQAVFEAYICPSDGNRIFDQESDNNKIFLHNFVGCTGSADFGHNPVIANGENIPNNKGVLGLGSFDNYAGVSGYHPYQCRLSGIKDGTSNTMLVSESIPPEDCLDGNTWRGLLGRLACGYSAAYAPNAKTDYMARLCGTMSFEGYNCVPIASAPGKNGNVNAQALYSLHTARSYHSGGVNAGFVDGSVRFVPDSIDLSVWRAVATIKGKEKVTLDF